MILKKSPLKKEQLAQFKKALEEARAQLLGQISSTAQEVQRPDEATGYSQHQADEGTDDFDRTINIELSSSEQGVLRQIDRALAKIEENTYGICDITGDKIPLTRLQAMPHACTTVEAQSKLEKGLL